LSDVMARERLDYDPPDTTGGAAGAGA
jgi:hypothetical protein